jgi:hypothetical protein
VRKGEPFEQGKRQTEGRVFLGKERVRVRKNEKENEKKMKKEKKQGKRFEKKCESKEKKKSVGSSSALQVFHLW